MEDFENYKIFFYILIAILYFLFSGKKKPKPVVKKQETPKEVVEKPVSSVPKSPGQLLKKEETFHKSEDTKKPLAPFTLEDVLKEFGNTLPENKEVKSRPMEREILEDVKPVVIDYDENIEDEEEVQSLEQKRGEISVFGKDEHFDPYTLNKNHENKYAAFLSNPDGLKTAFIAKEILDRKHF